MSPRICAPSVSKRRSDPRSRTRSAASSVSVRPSWWRAARAMISATTSASMPSPASA